MDSKKRIVTEEEAAAVTGGDVTSANAICYVAKTEFTKQKDSQLRGCGNVRETLAGEENADGTPGKNGI